MKQSINQTSKPKRTYLPELDLLRFPLAVAVIIVHVLGRTQVDMYGEMFDFMTMPLYKAANYFMWAFISEYSVIIYFFISGFVFFLGDGKFDAATYKRKLRTRVNTLLIPYIVWNLVVALVFLLYYVPPISHFRPGLDFNNLDFSLSAILNIFWDSHQGVFAKEFIANTDQFFFLPLNCDLWFLMSLMIMAVCSPAIYWLVKKFGLYFVAVAFVAYVLVFISGDRSWSQITTALFPFAFGTYMSISGRDMKHDFGKLNLVSAIAYLLLCSLAMIAEYRGDDVMFNIVKPISSLPGLLVGYNLSAWLLRRRVCKVVPLLVSSSMFVYVAHYVLEVELLRVMMFMLRPEGQVATLAIYVLTIALITGSLLGIYWFMQRYTPRLQRFTTGRK